MSWVPLNAALGRWLVPFFIRFKISPHQVTLLSLAAGGCGAGLFLAGGRGGMVAGAAAFLAANVLDECDGSVARATGTSSGFGSWLDTVAGCLIHIGFFAALGVALSRQLGQRLWLVLGGWAAFGVFVSTTAFVVGQSLVRGREGLRHPDPPSSGRPNRLEFLKETLRTDFSLLVLAAAWVGRLHWILVGAALGAFLFWIPADLWMMFRLRREIP